jgi:hypothetical protein
MNSTQATCLSTLLALALPAGSYAAKVVSDLQPPQKRQASVATAERLARRGTPSPLETDLKSPFNPPGFGRAEQTAAPSGPTTVEPNAPPPPPGDREVIEAVAAQLNPSGMIVQGGTPLLVMGSKRFEVGTRFTVTYSNQDYELELVSIDRTTFTLRYRGEQITRPIKSVR